jgi:Mor family transcriptional regulator
MTGARFVQDLVSAMPSPQARMILIAVLARYEGRSIHLPRTPKAERRQQAASNMLGNHMDTAKIVSALVERFGISDRQAHRDIKAARQNGKTNVIK